MYQYSDKTLKPHNKPTSIRHCCLLSTTSNSSGLFAPNQFNHHTSVWKGLQREKKFSKRELLSIMRITAELLAQAEQRTNPLGERELVLQGLGIPAIENAAATRDAFDCWDLSNNRIARLDNFPKLTRLSSLLCSGNLIESLDGKNLASNLPNIKYLCLSYNNISSLAEIANLGKAFPNLEFLDLVGNPVTSKYTLSGSISVIYHHCLLTLAIPMSIRTSILSAVRNKQSAVIEST